MKIIVNLNKTDHSQQILGVKWVGFFGESDIISKGKICDKNIFAENIE